jgi:hypothetical protein
MTDRAFVEKVYVTIERDKRKKRRKRGCYTDTTLVFHLCIFRDSVSILERNIDFRIARWEVVVLFLASKNPVNETQAIFFVYVYVSG